MKKYVYFSLAVSAISVANSLYAATPEGSIRLEAGTEYDSNLGVVELDQYSTQSDWAALLNARLNGRWKANEKLDVKAGFYYLTKTYHDNENFDLALQQLFADASYNFDLFTLGASYHHADAELFYNCSKPAFTHRVYLTTAFFYAPRRITRTKISRAMADAMRRIPVLLAMYLFSFNRAIHF